METFIRFDHSYIDTIVVPGYLMCVSVALG